MAVNMISYERMQKLTKKHLVFLRKSSHITVRKIISAVNRKMSSLKFKKITGDSDRDMDIVKFQFDKIIRPIYGSQQKAIQQIETSSDRVCEILYDGDVAVGILVYKIELQNEFKNFGACNSLEIKSMFVINPVNNKGKGYGRFLIDRVFKISAEKKASGSHVTISETVKDSLRMFERNEFQIIHTWVGKYKAGVKEHLLFWKSP